MYRNSVCVVTKCLAALRDRLITSRASLHSRKRGNTSQESKYILDLPFITNTTYSQRLSQLQLLPLTYWHEYLDLIFFFKCVNGIIDVNNETSPKPAQSNKTTRSTDANCFLYETKLYHTSTYQKSFVCRTIRTWNTLPKPIRSNTNSLSSFRRLLFKYYTTALNNYYNVDGQHSSLVYTNSKILYSCKYSNTNQLLILEVLLIKRKLPELNCGLKASKQLSLFL